MRLEFENDTWVTVSEGEYGALDGSQSVYLEIPRTAVYFLGK
jgi:hypothetical protein